MGTATHDSNEKKNCLQQEIFTGINKEKRLQETKSKHLK
jgi:hypothetical protein